MTEDQIVLPSAIAEIVPAMNAAMFVKMGFNIWTNEFMDAACTTLKDVYGGNKDAAAAIQEIDQYLKTYNRAAQ